MFNLSITFSFLRVRQENRVQLAQQAHQESRYRKHRYILYTQMSHQRLCKYQMFCTVVKDYTVFAFFENLYIYQKCDILEIRFYFECRQQMSTVSKWQMHWHVQSRRMWHLRTHICRVKHMNGSTVDLTGCVVVILGYFHREIKVIRELWVFVESRVTPVIKENRCAIIPYTSQPTVPQ